MGKKSINCFFLYSYIFVDRIASDKGSKLNLGFLELELALVKSSELFRLFMKTWLLLLKAWDVKYRSDPSARLRLMTADSLLLVFSLILKILELPFS